MTQTRYEQLLEHIVQNDDRFIVLTAENRAAIRSLPLRIPNNFLDTGITEQTMIGMAAGLALRGRIPICHALAAFLTMRAFEFIRTDIGIASLPVKLVGYVPGLLSEANGPTHQAIEDISIMRGVPNVNVFSPADEDDLLIGLPSVLLSPKPYYIRYTNAKPVTKHDPVFQEGKAECYGETGDVCILTHGYLFKQAFESADHLGASGISTMILNMRTLKPVDEDAILRAAQTSQCLVVLEDHFETGGLSTIVAEVLTRRMVRIPVLPIAFHHRWFRPGLMDDVLTCEGLTGTAIASRIMMFLENTVARATS
ncbi:MAG: transketolase [Candidatus Kapabacteria bacterium]|nr:transketolase [Candidatus Kapabacteria bacterium]